MACSLERVVRPAPTERTNVDRRGARRGNDGLCRRERVNGETDAPKGRTCRRSERELTCHRRNGNRLAIE